MNAKQLAAHTLVAIAIATATPMTMATAQDERHAERPEALGGIVRDMRMATERFQDVSGAIAAGYVSTGSCVSGPEQGAMGVHYVNEALIADGVLDVQRPEVLVYEPRAGRLRLVAVEFSCVDYTGEAAAASAR